MANNISKEDLSELNAIFQEMGGVEKVESYTNNFEQLPDGNYLGEIESVQSKNSKSTGRPMIDLVVTVSESEKEYIHLMLAGENLKKTQTAIARTITQLRKLGVDVSSNDIRVITSEAENLVGTRVNMEIKTTNNFRNVSLDLV